jgi:hypothetical protein
VSKLKGKRSRHASLS